MMGRLGNMTGRLGNMACRLGNETGRLGNRAGRLGNMTGVQIKMKLVRGTPVSRGRRKISPLELVLV